MIPTPMFAIALPFLGGVGAPELIIILVIVLILFGPKRLPQLGKSIGKTMKSLKDGIDGKLDEGDDADAEETASTKKDAAPDAAAKKPAASADKPSTGDSEDS